MNHDSNLFSPILKFLVGTVYNVHFVPDLQTLTLNSIKLDNESLLIICRILNERSNLVELNLVRINLGEFSNLSNLFKSIQNSVSIIKLRMSKVGIHGGRWINYIKSLLARNNTLQYLDISDNNLYLGTFLTAIGYNKKLKFLDLSTSGYYVIGFDDEEDLFPDCR